MQVHPFGMKYDRLWERLNEYVDEWASARVVPGGIEITFEQSPGVTRTVEVVITVSDWNNYVSTIYGTGDPRVTGLKAQVLATPSGAPFLVYDTYDWVPSETRDLPRDDFDPGPGEWMVVDDHGNAVARFADLDERD